MTRRRFLAALDLPRVEAAIARAEDSCNVELRVSVAGLFWGDPDAVAHRAFGRLAMTATARRNGVLVFVAPWRRKVAIVADQGITARVEAGLWSAAVATITTAFRTGQYTEGLVTAVDGLATALAPHFPPEQRANELPDTVDR
jgi:uncharacterized membrane protein